MHLLFPHLAWTTSNLNFVPTLPSSYTTSIYKRLFNLLAIIAISAHPNLNSFIASSRSLEEELPRWRGYTSLVHTHKVGVRTLLLIWNI